VFGPRKYFEDRVVERDDRSLGKQIGFLFPVASVLGELGVVPAVV
jgi:hypothetical protein